jgi:dolichol kinase
MIAAIALSAVMLAAVIVVCLKNDDKIRTLPLLFAAFLIAACLSFLLGMGKAAPYGNLAFLYFGLAAAFFFSMTLYYKKSYAIFFLFAAIAVAQLLFAVLYFPLGTAMRGLVLAFGIGTGLGFLFLDKDAGRKEYKMDKRIEINRDLLQILMGVVVVALVLLIRREYIYSYMILGFILLGYTLNSMVASTGRTTRLSGPFRRLEREGAIYGTGATYAAAGTAIMLGAISDSHFLAFACVALFIGDSVATLAGENLPLPKLHYNRQKSLSGFIAFFVFTAVIGFLLIGIYAIPLAFLLAVVESISTRFDDNLTVPIAAVAAYFLLSVI